MRPGPPASTYWILWLGLLSAIGLYAGLALSGVIGAVETPPAEAAPGSEADPPLTRIFAIVAAGNLVLAFVVRRLGRPPPYAGELSPGGFRLPPLVAHVASWALAEAVAIFGLVLALLGEPREWWLTFMGTAAFAMVLLKPTPPRPDDGFPS